MRRIFRREQGQVRSIEPDAVQMNEVRIAALFLTDTEKIHDPIHLIDAHGLCHIAFAGRDWVLQLPGCEIVKIKLSPVIALGKPNHFIGCRKKTPVRPIVSTLKIGIDVLFEHIANFARTGVSNTQRGALVSM